MHAVDTNYGDILLRYAYQDIQPLELAVDDLQVLWNTYSLVADPLYLHCLYRWQHFASAADGRAELARGSP